jgi:hypothetical protein
MTHARVDMHHSWPAQNEWKPVEALVDSGYSTDVRIAP